MAATVTLLYGLWLSGYVAHGGNIRTFLHLGQLWIDRSSHTPHPLRLDPTFPVQPGAGYDGQWVFLIARDPLHARYVIDDPPYRYGRILLPAVVRVLSLGREELMPQVILGLNFAWIVVGSAALAFWLRRRSESAGWALAYGLYPGVFLVFQLDLTEAMAFGLAAVGIVCCDRGDRRGRLLGGLAFGLAALTRDQAILFGAAYAIYELLRRRPGGRREMLSAGLPRALQIGLPALLPLVAWDLLILSWLHAIGPDTSPLERLPFYGLWVWIKDGVPGFLAGGVEVLQIENLQVLLPTTVLCAGACAVAAWRRHFSPEWLALLLNTTVIVFMDRGEWHDFEAGGRAAIGMVLAAITFAPATRSLLPAGRAWFVACTGLWLGLAALWLLVPDAIYLRELLHAL